MSSFDFLVLKIFNEHKVIHHSSEEFLMFVKRSYVERVCHL